MPEMNEADTCRKYAVPKQRRVLLTMATGTGKTLVAFQICWKL